MGNWVTVEAMRRLQVPARIALERIDGRRIADRRRTHNTASAWPTDVVLCRPTGAMAPLLRRDFPRAWDRYRSLIKAPSHLAKFDAMAAGPVIPIDRIIAGVKDSETADDGAVPPEPSENEMSAS
jgi:hypothetical protein